jgi:hypothetical protein
MTTLKASLIGELKVTSRTPWKMATSAMLPRLELKSQVASTEPIRMLPY